MRWSLSADTSIRSRIWRLAILACFTLAALAIVLTWTRARTREANLRVEHIHDVILALQTYSSELVNAETGQRGYLLTHQDDYLAPYQLAVDDHKNRLARLADLLGDDPEQTKLAALSELFDDKLTELGDTIALARAGDQAGALAVVLDGRGRRFTVEFQRIAQEIADIEAGRLAAARASVEAETRRVIILMESARVLALILIIGTAMRTAARIDRPLRSLMQAITALANGDLGHRVDVRTRDEIGKVSTAFNGMADRLAAADQARAQADKVRGQLGALVASSSDAIISKTLDGIVTGWNPAAETMFGYTEQEMIGQPMAILIPPDRADEEPQILARIRAGRTVEHFETIRRRKNGEFFPVSVTISPIRDAGGTIIGASKIARDITDQKSAEAELLRHRDHLEEMVVERTAQLADLSALHKAILDSAACAIAASDIDGTTTVFNPAAETMFGFTADEFMGRIGAGLLLDRDEVEARRAELSMELGCPVEGMDVFFAKPRRGQVDAREWTFIRKDGTRIPVWMSLTAVKTTDGRLIGYLAILDDLTQRKRADKEKQRLLDILELSPDFIGTADLNGNLRYLNRAAKDLLGLPANADLSTWHIRDLHPAWANEIVAKQTIPAVLRDGMWRGEIAVLHQDGHEIPVSLVSFAHRDSDGSAEMMSAIMRDIREQKWREAELGAARDLAESASEAKGQFLTSMSHELRTPLNAILGFAQLLDSEQMQPTAAQKKDFVDHILKAGRHLLELINEILDLAKIESGTVSLSSEPVALVEILRECATLVEPLGTLRGVSLLFPEKSDLHVIADRIRFKQILLNLLSNAIKYNRENGSVVVSCSAVEPGVIRISVQDTGLGLAPEQVDKLFQPFERLGQEAGSQEGTGIGLVVTKRLIELMGGRIGLTSTVGVGSVFWVELNATDPVAPALVVERRQAASMISASDGKPTLLYVEDNTANLKLVEEVVLLRGDLHIISAPDGNIGVEFARAHLPQVILMDIHLPGMSGSEAQQILKHDPRTAHIPVIALTASVMPREIEKGLSAGFFRYVTKPIDIAELMEAIDSALALMPADKPILLGEHQR